MHLTALHVLTWAIAALATAGVIARPWKLPEAVWAVAGAALLVALRLLPWRDALRGVGKGGDVYFFLVGMMLLAELARGEGLFAWLAAHAARAARGSATRLFALVFLVGTVVTALLSNDATAVVLTPAVASAVKTARVDKPLPYLLVCAFVANAASFVLPISNPANLVIEGRAMPPLLAWLPRFALPSLLALGATYLVLRWTQRASLRGAVATDVVVEPLAPGGRATALGLGATALALLTASALDAPLGLPTCIAGVATVALVTARTRRAPWPVLRGVAWSVLPLVAGLFVLVEALDATGVIRALAGVLRERAQGSVAQAAWASGVACALGSNLVNNLPAGLVAADTVRLAHAPRAVTDAVLVGIDLGPTLSVTGSLATILWLGALRRDGHHVSAWQYLKVGALVMPPALLLALGALLWVGAPR